MAFKSIAELKKSRGAVADLQAQVEKMASKGYEKDARFWKPTADKAGTGAAQIRFLPAPKGEDIPWVQVWSHSFKGPTGKFYIENSLTTLGKSDPVSELNTELWNSGDAGKEIARKQKRKLSYISNILVIKDAAHPENEGKVFLYKYGKKIFDKIKDKMTPPDGEDETEMNPFDFWEGATFKLLFQEVNDFRNYDKSAFKAPSAISESDAQIEEIWNSEYSLQEFLDPKNFKSYEELQDKLNQVLKGGPVSSTKPRPKDEDDDDVLPPPTKKKPAAVVEEDEEEEVKPAPKKAKKAVVVEEDEEEEVKPKAKAKKPATKEPVEDEDDVLSHFANLAKDDED